mgnify:CR=1 FL=1
MLENPYCPYCKKAQFMSDEGINKHTQTVKCKYCNKNITRSQMETQFMNQARVITFDETFKEQEVK